jgi:hypothetical protein
MFVKSSDIEDVSPILAAQVFVRHLAYADLSMQHDLPTAFDAAGVFRQKTRVATATSWEQRRNQSGSTASAMPRRRIDLNYPNQTLFEMVDMEDADYKDVAIVGDGGMPFSGGGPIPTVCCPFLDCGIFVFNRQQTQSLLNGQPVKPTSWINENEGSAEALQESTIPWLGGLHYVPEFTLTFDS